MLIALVAAGLATAAPTNPSDPVEVPMVGCPSDGQQGPQPAPRPQGPAPRLPQAVAARLAYYESSELGVLAPRGWHCLGLEGSDASSLVITPEPHGFADRHHLRGPAVLITLSFGGTSGRFAVASAIARYFPSKRDFANQVADDGLMEGPMPSGPYPADRLERPSANVVRFTTPAGTQGQGTDSLLAVTADPVLGAVLLLDSDDEPNLIQVSVRLPAQDGALAERIVDRAQLDYANAD